MRRKDEKEEKRLREQKTASESINSTLNSPGWTRYIFPKIIEIYSEYEEEAFDEGEDAMQARAICKGIRKILSEIGVQIDKGNKAKEGLLRLLNK